MLFFWCLLGTYILGSFGFLCPFLGLGNFANIIAYLSFKNTYTFIYRYEVYMRKPGKMETSDFYLEIFPFSTWVTEALCILLLPFIFYVTCFICKRFDLKKHQLCISDCYLHVMSLITNQGEVRIINIF